MKHLASLLNIQPGEGRLFLLMYLHYFLMGVAFHFTQTAAFAIFLANFSAQKLPWVYIINAVAITVLVSGYLKLHRRVSFATMLAVNLAFLLALTAFFGFGTPAGAAWLIFTLPTLFELTVQLGNLEFWTLAGRLFNIRQGKRLFGLVGSGNWLAVIIGGFLTPSLVALLGTANLLWISVGALLLTLLVLLLITRLFAGQLVEPPAEPVSARQTASSANLLKSRYVTLIFAIVSLFWLAFYFIDNIFFIRAAERFSSEAELASFLGIFFGVFGVVALVVSVGLTGPIIGRFGVRVAVRVLPVSLLIGAALMVGLGLAPNLFLLLFWITAAAKLIDMAFGFTLDRTVLNILYQPLPVSQRVRVKTTAEGLFVPRAIGLAGAALLFFNWILGSATQLSLVLLVIVTGWVVAAVWIGREYPVTLLKALTRRRLSGVDLPLEDGSSQAVLRQALHQSQPAAALFALNQLTQASPAIFADELPALLAHPAAEVRREALRRARQLGQTSALAAIRHHLQNEVQPDVRVEAVRALAALGQSEVVEELFPLLDSVEPAVKSAAIIGLLQHGSVEVTMPAEGKLLQLAMSSEPAHQIIAAQIIGQVKARNLSQLLDTLLQTEDVEVRQAALLAAGQAGFAPLWPRVIDNLATRKTRSAAVAALIAGGNTALDAIAAALDQPALDHASRSRLLAACGRIGGQPAIQILLRHLSAPADDRRTGVVAALGRCGFQAGPAERPVIELQLDREIEFAGELLCGLEELTGDGPAWALLRQSLQDRFRQTQERLLLLLSFLGRPEALLPVKDNLFDNQPDKRAYALEMIEISVPATFKARLFPLLEPLTPAERLARLATPPRLLPAERLEKLIRGPHWWTSACALYVTPFLAHISAQLQQAIADCVNHPEPIVVETAQLALRQIKKTGFLTPDS